MVQAEGGNIINSRAISSIERQDRILSVLQERGRLLIPDICREFEVSEATARRDLEELSRNQKIKRIHGGAILLRQAKPEDPILRRTTEHQEEKIAIGKAAANIVDDGETIFLGSGTTVLEVARNLTNKNITVITNSLPIINLLYEHSNISLIALGGVLRESELSFIGHITEQTLNELGADKVIIGIRALSLENGLMSDYLPETLTDRAILKISKNVIAVADHTKLGVISTISLAPINAIQTLVTDNQINPDFLEELGMHSIHVIIA